MTSYFLVTTVQKFKEQGKWFLIVYLTQDIQNITI